MEDEKPVVWDAHSCLPIEADVTFGNLDRHRAVGFDFVSVNVAMDMTPLESTLKAIAYFRECIRYNSGKYMLATTVADVETAKRTGRLAISFDIEGAECLLGRPEMVGLYADLGVRQMHLAYNLNNAYAGGCHDNDGGLTELGRAVVEAANHYGVTMDCSHSGHRSSLEIMELSSKPVVFSHSNPLALAESKRNITDEQILACASTGGVVGICGYSRFLGAIPSTGEDMARHIDYVAKLAGVEHVGIGWDYTYPHEGIELAASAGEYRKYFIDATMNEDEGVSDNDAYTPLEHRTVICDALEGMGYGSAEIDHIMGGNFLRVARESWPPQATTRAS